MMTMFMHLWKDGNGVSWMICMCSDFYSLCEIKRAGV